MVNAAGATTMRRELQEASLLCPKNGYLPYAVNRKRRIEQEKPGGFTILARYARNKRRPDHYFARVIHRVDTALGIINMLSDRAAVAKAKKAQEEFFAKHGLAQRADYDRVIAKDKYAKVRGMFGLWIDRLNRGWSDDDIWAQLVPVWCKNSGEPIPSLV